LPPDDLCSWLVGTEEEGTPADSPLDFNGFKEEDADSMVTCIGAVDESRNVSAAECNDIIGSRTGTMDSVFGCNDVAARLSADGNGVSIDVVAVRVSRNGEETDATDSSSN
jgi:hypothetical protein